MGEYQSLAYPRVDESADRLKRADWFLSIGR
jgi:hypothetical protein